MKNLTKSKLRITFKSKQAEAKEVGLVLERDPQDGHPYCLWVNSSTGSKEIWIRNLREEFDQAKAELLQVLQGES